MTRSKPLPLADEESFRNLLEKLRPYIKQMLRKYDIPSQDAEDLVQEALLIALTKWDSIRYKPGWIMGALRFKCSNYWRKQRGERVLGMDLTLLEDLSEPVPPAQEQEEIALDLRSLTRDMDPRQRAALWYRFGVGMNDGEIGRRLGYCPSSIRKLTGRSLTKLQRQWAATIAKPSEEAEETGDPPRPDRAPGPGPKPA